MDPLGEVMLTEILGAGSSEATWQMLDSIVLCSDSALVDADVVGLGSRWWVGLLQQTLAK